MKYVEDEHQEMIFTWSENIRLDPLRYPVEVHTRLFDYMFAIPNGGKRNAKEAARLKKQGVKAGIPDMFIALPVGAHSGLFLELKRPIVKGEPKPTVSTKQREILKRYSRAGYYTCVACGFDEAVMFIKNYLKGQYS